MRRAGRMRQAPRPKQRSETLHAWAASDPTFPLAERHSISRRAGPLRDTVKRYTFRRQRTENRAPRTPTVVFARVSHYPQVTERTVTNSGPSVAEPPALTKPRVPCALVFHRTRRGKLRADSLGTPSPLSHRTPSVHFAARQSLVTAPLSLNSSRHGADGVGGLGH